MKIACVILGTRGDVQPMVALATGLIKKGHEVIICAPPENEEAESISSAIRECATNDTYKKNAAEMSERLKDANGIDLTVQLIEKILYPGL